MWRAPALDVNRAIDVALALPTSHALTALRLPSQGQGADPARLEQLAQRFPGDFYALRVG